MGIAKKITFAVLALVLSFVVLEGLARVFVFPGSYGFIERRIIEEALPQRKPAGEFRIFLFGESTMQGHYLYPYSTVDIWMRMYLKDLLPPDAYGKVRIVNFGRYGATSSFIAKAFTDTLRYRPDLAVFYSAHNDFCLFGNRREFFTRKSPAEAIEDIGKELPRHSALLNAINRLAVRAKIKKHKLRESQLSKLDTWYPEDDKGPEILDNDLLWVGSPKFEVLRKNFEKNIRGIIDTARRRSIPVIFLEGVAKWRGYEPVRSFHGETLKGDGLNEWDAIFAQAGKAFAAGDYAAALVLYKRCIEADPDYALTYYRIAQIYEALGDPAKANEYYAIANDRDRYLIRAPSAVNAFYETVRADQPDGVYVIRTQKAFEEGAADGIIGDALIGDQIHPSVDGQALIALEIVRTMYEAGMVAPKSEWRWRGLRSAEEMKKELRFSPAAELEIDLAIAGYLQKDYRKSVGFLEKSAGLRPDSLFVKSWLAWTYWKLGERDKALAIYRALERESHSASQGFFARHPEIGQAL